VNGDASTEMAVAAAAPSSTADAASLLDSEGRVNCDHTVESGSVNIVYETAPEGGQNGHSAASLAAATSASSKYPKHIAC